MKSEEKKVAILMSTYNGEKYISDQINSIINQTYQSWHLFIRDDGSTDNTRKIITKFCRRDDRITLFYDRVNLRPARSFLTLITKIDADFYFFSDQDDYWLKDKMQIMLDKIIKRDNTQPQLVYCNLKCVDENLKPKKYGFDNLIGKISGINRFIGNDMPGCVMLFNKATRDLTKKYTVDFTNIVMHDWWIAIIAQTFGNITFINKRLIYYRQHGNNTLGAGKAGSTFKKMFQKGLIKKQENLVKQSFLQDMCFRKSFYSILPDNVVYLLDQMSKCSNCFFIYRIFFLKKYNFKQISTIRTLAYYFTFIFLFNKSIYSKDKG